MPVVNPPVRPNYNPAVYVKFDGEGLVLSSILVEFYNEDEHGPVGDWELTDRDALNSAVNTAAQGA